LSGRCVRVKVYEVRWVGRRFGYFNAKLGVMGEACEAALESDDPLVAVKLLIWLTVRPRPLLAAPLVSSPSYRRSLPWELDCNIAAVMGVGGPAVTFPINQLGTHPRFPSSFTA